MEEAATSGSGPPTTHTLRSGGSGPENRELFTHKRVYFFFVWIYFGKVQPDVSCITNLTKLVVLNLSTDSESPPDVMVETFRASVSDK